MPPKVLVLILAQLHTSTVALGKFFHVSELISLPVNWQQQPHLPKEGAATQKRTLAQLVAQSELEVHGCYCVLYGKSPRKRFHAFVGPLSLGSGVEVWGNGEGGR